MKDKVKIAILLFFISFLSFLNLKNGLVFKTTDNTERDAVFSLTTESPEKAETIKSDIKSVNIPAAAKTTAKSTNSSKNTNSGPKTLNLTGVKTVSKNCDSDMSVMPSGAYFCHYKGSASTFIYGHNNASTFGKLYTLSVGDYIKIKINGQVKTYQVVNTFRLNYEKDLKGSSNNDTRVKLYASNYGNKWGGASRASRITFQTCEGKNDMYRRYIQAVEV